VSAGEIFGLLGRNGSGKTTTVRMLTTLARPTSGHATVAGFDVVRQAAQARRSIGAALQDAMLDPFMSGREHLNLVGRLLGVGRREVASRSEALLGSFGLSDAADRPIGSYSGGMQRRLDIATALFARPPVLFLDEPTTGLDPQSRHALWDEIRSMRADGTTLLLTTQYLEEADQLADRIAVIDRGSLIATGAPRELRSQHGTRTITLHGEHHATVLTGNTVTGTVTPRDGLTVVEVPPGSSVDEVLHHLRSAVGTLDDVLTISDPSLEDVFVHLTGRSINPQTAPHANGAVA
jgi:ABC-2 type transport system ATP-binding protein